MTDWRQDLIGEVRALRWTGRSDETGMPPCQDTRAELQLLSCMLYQGADADPEWFYDDLHAWLAGHILTARTEHITLTLDHMLALGARRGIAEDTMRGLWRQVERQSWSMDPDAVGDRVEEMARRRVLCSVLRRVVAALETDQRGAGAAMEYLRGLEL